jgi:hypothetical protein
MAGSDEGRGISMNPLRERAQEALIDAYAADHLSDAELERRLDEVHRAQNLDELRSLLADLPGPNTALTLPENRAPASSPGTQGALAAPNPYRTWSVAPADRVKPKQFLLGFWGGAARRGAWTPARQVLGLAFQGGIELDFRQASFAPGVTTVTILAIMGGVQIIVPEGVTVETRGTGIMGGFDGTDRLGDDPHGPVLRIDGLALMGGVEVKVVSGLPKKLRDAARKVLDRPPVREE